MKKLIALPFLFLLLACAKEDNPITTVDLETVFGVAETASPLGGEGRFFENVNYGDRERQQLDILLPESANPKGIVLFFHGGGFTAGDKSQAFDDLLIEETLANGQKPILCIGEKLDEFEAKKTNDVVKTQLVAGLKNVSNDNIEDVVIAYEPV